MHRSETNGPTGSSLKIGIKKKKSKHFQNNCNNVHMVIEVQPFLIQFINITNIKTQMQLSDLRSKANAEMR